MHSESNLSNEEMAFTLKFNILLLLPLASSLVPFIEVTPGSGVLYQDYPHNTQGNRTWYNARKRCRDLNATLAVSKTAGDWQDIRAIACK